MAKEVKKHGTGITSYEVPHYSGEDLREGLASGSESMAKGIKEQGGLFGWRTSAMVEVADEILSVAGDGPYEDQTPEDYAYKIHSYWRCAKKAIAKGNADEAARWAYELGSLCAEAAMKFEWESDALRGHKNAGTLGENRDKRNRKRADEARRNHATWLECAKEIIGREPENKNLSDIARKISTRMAKKKENGEYTGTCDSGTIRIFLNGKKKEKKLFPHT